MRRAAQLRAAASTLFGTGDRQGAVVLAYHDVMDQPYGPYHVTQDQLDAQLDQVTRLGWTFVPLASIVDALVEGSALDGLAAVTFDDGRRGVRDRALPSIEERGIVMTVFAIADDDERERRMDDGQLRELVARGHTIGSHTVHHRSLPTLDDVELRAELDGSRRELAERVGAPVDFLAYPHGHFDERVRRAATEAGYGAGFTFINGKVAGSDDVMRLPRLNMGPEVVGRRLSYFLARGPAAWPDTQLEAMG